MAAGVCPVSGAAEDRPDWRQTLDYVQGQTQVILEKNKALNEEYLTLQAEMQRVQHELDQAQSAVDAQQQRNDQLSDRQKASADRNADMQAEVRLKDQALADRKGERGALRARLKELQDQSAQLQERVALLTEQKQDLLTKLKMQEMDKDAEGQLLTEEIKQLEELLVEYETQEAAADRDDGTAAKVNSLVEENRRLSQQEQDLRAQLQQKDPARPAAKGPAAEEIPPALLAEKAQLESQVEDLERQLSTIRDSVAETTATIEKKRALMDEIMQMDAEKSAAAPATLAPCEDRRHSLIPRGVPSRQTGP